MSRFRCVDDQKAAGFPVSAACEAAGVSTSGYYDWWARQAAGPTVRQAARHHRLTVEPVLSRRKSLKETRPAEKQKRDDERVSPGS